MKQTWFGWLLAACVLLSGCAAKTESTLERYRSTIIALHDSGGADRFALVHVDGDDVPELAAVSSEGAWDKEQVFLYTLDGDKPVLIVSDIGPGMEGHSVAFDEGENFVVRSGAVTGDRRLCFALGANGPEQVLSLEWSQDPADPDVIVYSVNGREVDEAHYLAQAGEVIASHDTMIRLDIEEMSVVSLSLENGCIMETVVGTAPYRSFEEILGDGTGGVRYGH